MNVDRGSSCESQSFLNSSSDDETPPVKHFLRRCLPNFVWKEINEIEILLFMVVVEVIVGVTFFMTYMGTSFLTSLYIIVQILTTIGYGDITIEPDESNEAAVQIARTFVALYALSTIIVVSYAINIFMSWTIGEHTRMMQDMIAKIESKALGVDEERLQQKFGKGNLLVGAGLTFVIFLAVGTLFYGWYERCTCSYGITYVGQTPNSTCTDSSHFDSHDACMAAGGFEKTYVDAFYMSVITLTTVGFGDFAPKTRLGRAFGVIWMMGGVAATAFFTAELSKYMFERRRRFEGASKLTKELFDTIDVEGTGYLSRAEYVNYILVAHGLVTQEYVDQINAKFDSMDIDETGVVTWENIQQKNAIRRTTRALRGAEKQTSGL